MCTGDPASERRQRRNKEDKQTAAEAQHFVERDVSKEVWAAETRKDVSG